MAFRIIATVLMLGNWVADLAEQADSLIPSGAVIAASTLATALVLFLIWAVHTRDEQEQEDSR